MNCHGVNVTCKHLPPLDPGFVPLLRFNRAFLEGARKPLGLAVERAGGQTAVYETFIHGTEEMAGADRYYIDRLAKTILWMKGGFRILVRGDRGIFEYLRDAYRSGGSRAFDADFMAGVYERPFEVLEAGALPAETDGAKAVGGHLNGCRIGFDAGGSDRKVSAVLNGETVYSEETVWHPKLQTDPQYHYDGIVASLRAAAAHLPRVDAVGVSSAGVFIEDRAMTASLFLKIPPERKAETRDVFIRAITDTFGPVPYSIINDGDVSALAGAMSLEQSNVLGLSMGTAEAGGFVDSQGRITGWLNELAFMPVDASPEAMEDEWSGDIGCGVKYFSQDGVIKLAPRAGIALDEALSPAEKLKVVQKRMEQGDPAAASVYESIGVYLAHSLAYYYDLYRCEHVLLLGRVMSGRGGDLILETCQKVLADEYPELAGKLHPALPDEKFRRVGQSMAAASLPEA